MHWSTKYQKGITAYSKTGMLGECKTQLKTFYLIVSVIFLFSRLMQCGLYYIYFSFYLMIGILSITIEYGLVFKHDF